MRSLRPKQTSRGTDYRSILILGLAALWQQRARRYQGFEHPAGCQNCAGSRDLGF